VWLKVDRKKLRYLNFLSMQEGTDSVERRCNFWITENIAVC